MTAFPWGTAAAVFKIATAPAAGVYQSVFSLEASTDDNMALFSDGDNSGRFSLYNVQGGTGVATGAAGQGIATTDGWMCCAMTKATGNTTPTFHRFAFAAGVHLHTAGAASTTDPTVAATGFEMGANHGNVDGFDGDIAAVMFIPKYVMSSSEIERLPEGDWAMYSDTGGPGFLVEFPPRDQPVAGASRDSSRSGARETSLTGTSRGTTNPPGFRFSRYARRR